MSETKAKLLDKFFQQLTKFVGAVSVVFNKCERTKDVHRALKLIQSQNLVAKKVQYAQEWHEGVRNHLDAFHAHATSAIMQNSTPLLRSIDLSGKWQTIDQECVWDHLDRINTTIVLWAESKDTPESDSAFGQTMQIAKDMMKDLKIESHENGRVSLDFSSVTDYIMNKVSETQMDDIVKNFGGGDGDFASLLKGGLGALTRTLATGPAMAQNTRVVDTVGSESSSGSDDED